MATKKPVKKASAGAAKKAAPKKSAAAKVKPAPPKKATPKKAAPKKAAEKKVTPKKTVPAVNEQKQALKKAPAPQPKPKPKKPEIIAPPPEPKPKGKLPSKRYSKTELEHFKKLILTKQAEAIENLQTLRDQMLDPSTGEYINENSPYSLHMAEQGTDAMEKEKTYFYAQREQKFLGYLEEALKRIEAGTYGLCVECIDEPKNLCPTCPLIPKERLEAVPHSQLCAQIKKMQEKPRRF